MQRERGKAGEPHVAGPRRPRQGEEDFREVRYRRELAGRGLESAADVVQALRVAPEQVIERRALVPGFGESRSASQERGEPRLCDVVAPCGDVAGRELQ